MLGFDHCTKMICLATITVNDNISRFQEKDVGAKLQRYELTTQIEL